MTEPERLRGPLSKLAAGLGIDDPEAFAFVFNEWPQIVGAQVAAKCRPVSMKKGVLKLRTESPGWAGQLRYLSRQILEAVNSRFKEPVVRRIEVSITTDPRDSETKKQGPKTNDRLPPAQPPRPGDDKKASELVSEIPDDALAEATKKAYLAGKMRSGRGR